MVIRLMRIGYGRHSHPRMRRLTAEQHAPGLTVRRASREQKKTLYEVKWQGFPGENTWEPADNLKNCECLVEFLLAQKPAEKTPVKTPGKKARETSPAHTHNYFAVLSPPDAARLTPDAA